MDEIAGHLTGQDGIVSRAQVLAAGGTDNDVERLLRRRVWARVHAGVYVEHTGPPTWAQRMWAATLLHAPAALDGRSALQAWGVLDHTDDEVELVVGRERRVADPPGVRTRQVRDFASVAMLHLSPPRVRVEHAALTAASQASSADQAVATLAAAVQRRRTTVPRLLARLEERRRLRHRAVLAEVLGDVASGAHSALERRYLLTVERAHGLPPGDRQAPTEVGRHGYRDIHYRAQRCLVELDGRLGHDSPADGWVDLERDVDALTDGLPTLRAGWHQALDPCRLASVVGRLLHARGWDGEIEPCGPTCTADGRGSPAPGAGDPPPSAT